MSQSNDALEVLQDGIQVEKRFEAEEFPVPAIRFGITSERDEAVTVRIADDIPQEFSMDGVGFHPDYEAENWTAYEDHHVEYERTLQPGEQVVTVYGVRASTMEEVQSFLTEPTVRAVEPSGDGQSHGAEARSDDPTLEEIAPKESSQVVRDVLSGDRESVPGADGGATDGETARGSLATD
jgi:hypothetical protein